jgi:N-acetylmuramoyl-L-alanine amidase
MAKIVFMAWLACFSTVLIANGPTFHSVNPKTGDGVYSLLRRYDLMDHNCNLKKFYELNNLQKEDPLITSKQYKLPIFIYNYNGKSIRSTIGDSDLNKAKRIQAFNEAIKEKGLRSTHYTESKILWVPFHELSCTDKDVDFVESEPAKRIIKGNTVYEPVFGSKYANVIVEDNSLADRVYYIVSGHGGPDPGAMCKSCPSTLCEDEYAYDVSARLARNLMQHGAIVHLIIQDKNDGIRDDEILKCDKDERCMGKKLPLNQLARLKQRSAAVNTLYKKYAAQGVKEQKAIVIHVDSRSAGTKQDVFFYHYRHSQSGKKLAQKMHSVFDQKYAKYQKNRGYHGYVEGKGLYVLRTMAPTTLFIELANIRNKSDHRRLLLSSNRQALANWLFEGLTQ